MWRWVIGGLAMLAVLFAGFVIFSIQATKRAVKDVAEGLVVGAVEAVVPKGNIPQVRTLGDILQGQTPEAVALLSDGKWYLIRDVQAASGLDFQAKSPGLLGTIFGQGRCPTDAERVAIEPLVNGVVTKPINTCAGPQTEISALVAVAQPALLEEAARLTLAQWQGLDAKIRMDVALYPANRSAASRYDYACSYQFPHVWVGESDGRPYLMNRYEDGIRQAMAAGLAPDMPHDLRIDNGYSSSYITQPAEGLETSKEGWAVGTDFTLMTRGDARRKVPGLSVYHPEARLKGGLAACEAFVAIDFASLWQGDRDVAQLERAWGAGVPIEGGAAARNDWDRLVTSTPRLRKAAQLRHSYRHFRLP